MELTLRLCFSESITTDDPVYRLFETQKEYSINKLKDNKFPGRNSSLSQRRTCQFFTFLKYLSIGMVKEVEHDGPFQDGNFERRRL